MATHPNFLLARLDPEILGRMSTRAKVINLAQHDVIAETHRPMERVYFPHSGVISNVVELVGGGAIETGMVGRDGVSGAAQALDDKVALNQIVVQLSGVSTVVEASYIADLAAEFAPFRRLLLAYEQFSAAQMQQTAACNAVHKIEQRLCKWLLRMRDLGGEDLPLTQEFLSQMMGVRRSSVTEIALHLSNTGLIAYSRGRVRILDVDGLRAHACECHEQVKQNYTVMLEAIGRKMSPAQAERE